MSYIAILVIIMIIIIVIIISIIVMIAIIFMHDFHRRLNAIIVIASTVNTIINKVGLSEWLEHPKRAGGEG